MKKSNIRQKNQGITLITLIVTIIILIILATITINALLGENGLITMAQKARDKYEESAKNEEQAIEKLFGEDFASYNGQLYVKDGKILNQYDEPIQLNGIYYGYGNSEYSKEILTALKNRGVNLIKIGYNYSGGIEPYNKTGNMEAMYLFIDELLKMDFYIDIIYWSDIDLNTVSSEAIDYFTQITSKYPNNKQILYEICNEPFENTWEEVKSYADKVIPEIRKISSNAIISVPTNDNMFNEIFLSNLLEYKNIMYVTHIYAGNTSLKNIKNAITNYNLTVFISEWSNINSSATDYDNEITDNLIYMINQYKIANSAWYFDGSGKKDSIYFMIKKEYWNQILKTGEISNEMLGIAGKYYFDFIQGINKGKKGGILVNYNLYSTKYENMLFWDERYRTNITKIIFENKIEIPENTIKTWDVSFDNSETVMAYIIDDSSNTGTYELHICGDNRKVMVTSLYCTFEGFSKLEYIDITQLDTSKVENMSRMFREDGKLQNIEGLNSIDTSNVTNMNAMFYLCEDLKSLILENFNTINVTDMSSMFHGCSKMNLLDISSFNTTNVTTMYDMFSGTGMSSSDFELILGKEFDTSNVTNMEMMFQLTGDSNPKLTLDLTNFTFREDLNYNDMFEFLDSTVTVYVRDEAMQQFVINAREGNVWTTKNVIIK